MNAERIKSLAARLSNVRDLAATLPESEWRVARAIRTEADHAEREARALGEIAAPDLVGADE